MCPSSELLTDFAKNSIDVIQTVSYPVAFNVIVYNIELLLTGGCKSYSDIMWCFETKSV